MHDKRSKRRVVPRDLLTASLIQRGVRPFHGIVSDLSELGARVISNGWLPQERHLQMSIFSTMEQTQPLIQTEGQIVWAVRSPNERNHPSAPFEMGVQFTAIRSSHRSGFLRVLREGTTVALPPQSAPTPLEPPTPPPETPPVDDLLVRPIIVAPNADTFELDFVGGTAPESGISEDVVIVKEAFTYAERARDAVFLAGYWPIVVESVEPLLVLAKSKAPSLVILSEGLGSQKFSDAARRVKSITQPHPVPIAAALNPGSNPWLRQSNYPVEATIDLNAEPGQLAQTLRLISTTNAEPRKRPEPGALEGDLGDDMLFEILQYLFTAQKRGRVTVRFWDRTGHIYFDGGTVIHCELGDTSGKDAFIQVLDTPQHGYFRFDTGLEPNQITMNENGMELVLEATRQRDHRARTRTQERVTAFPNPLERRFLKRKEG